MIQKTSAPGSAEPQLRNACLSFWSVEAELGLRVPGKEEPVFFKIWYKSSVVRKEKIYCDLILKFLLVIAGIPWALVEGMFVFRQGLRRIISPTYYVKP